MGVRILRTPIYITQQSRIYFTFAIFKIAYFLFLIALCSFIYS